MTTTTTAAPDRASRKTRIGVVTSTRMAKTIVVRVDRLERHSRYPRTLRRSSKFLAHDEQGQAKLNDTVRIVETRPLSKRKRWRLVEVLRHGLAATETAPTTAEDGSKRA